MNLDIDQIVSPYEALIRQLTLERAQLMAQIAELQSKAAHDEA